MKHIVKKDFNNTVIAYLEQIVQQRFSAFVRQSDKSNFTVLNCSNQIIDGVKCNTPTLTKDEIKPHSPDNRSGD